MPRRRLHPIVLLAPFALILAGCVVAVVVWAMDDDDGRMRWRFQGVSMEPTFDDGDTARFDPYDGAPIGRGQIVLHRFHLDPERTFAKRVIGLPGETVEVRDGSVYIDGAPLEEHYLLNQPKYEYGPRTVPDGHYFVLGDNRRNSFDSHAWAQSCPPEQQCDFVPQANIIGVLPADAKDSD